MAGMGAASRGPSQDGAGKTVWARWPRGGETAWEAVQETAASRRCGQEGMGWEMAWGRRQCRRQHGRDGMGGRQHGQDGPGQEVVWEEVQETAISREPSQDYSLKMVHSRWHAQDGAGEMAWVRWCGVGDGTGEMAQGRRWCGRQHRRQPSQESHLETTVSRQCA